MKKLLLVLIILAVAVPASASVVITCEQIPRAHYGTGNDGNVVTVKYNATTEVNNVRAFGLEIELIDNIGANNAVITEVYGYFVGECTAGSQGYGIFPGTIVIDGGGVVTEYGTPVAPNTDPGAAGTGLGTNKIVVEMGSLYTGANSPPAQGILLKFRVNNKCCDIKISENTERGGVVMENPDEAVTVVAPGNGSAQYAVVMPGDICGFNYGAADCVTNIWDYMRMSANWTTMTDSRCDLRGFNYSAPDGDVSIWDYLALSKMWSQSWQ